MAGLLNTSGYSTGLNNFLAANPTSMTGVPVTTQPPRSATPVVGAQAASPTTNVTAPKTTLTPAQTVTTPKVTLAQAQAANAANPYFNLSSPAAPTPATPAPQTGLLPAIINPVGSNNATLLPSSNAPAATTAPTATGTLQAALSTAPTNYTPPNQGTTGVSQGGLIGNLVNAGNGSQSPAVIAANAQLQADQAKLQTSLARAGTDSGDMGLALGTQGQINQAYNGIISADQTAVQNALTQNQQEIGATTAAGQLNAPVIASPGQVQISPSQPNPGSTTSGAASLNSLIGQRPSASSPGTTEFYNTQTGQGFATPQALADFVNQQNPSAGATAANVFSVLQTQGSGGSNILSLPPSTMATYAQMLASGQGSSIPSSITGNAALMAQLYQQAQTLTGGTFNANTAAGVGAAQQQAATTLGTIPSTIASQNAITGGTAGVSAGAQAYAQSYPAVQQLNQALNNITTLGNMTVQNAQGNNVNPFQFAPANSTLAQVKGMLSNTGQVTFNSNLASLQGAIEALYGASGGSTPSNITSQINAMADGSLSISGLQALLTAAQQEGAGKLANATATANSEYNQATSNGSSTTGTTATAGGHSFVQNAQGVWVAQ